MAKTTTTPSSSSSSSSESSSSDDYDVNDSEEDKEERKVPLSDERMTMMKMERKLKKHSKRVQKDIQNILSMAKSHANAHAISTREHVNVHWETTNMYCESIEKAVDSTEDLMQRVVSVAAFAAKLRALAKRTITLRIQAEVLEKMCEERGILVATSGGKRGNNNTSSPLSHGGGGGGVLSSLSPLRFFRSGSASPKKRNTPPASPSSRTSRSNDVFATSSFAKEDGERKKEEEEISRSSMTPPEVQTRPPLPPKNPSSSSSSPTPFDPSNIIASVVERKKIERLAELREIERVKEGKYGVVTPYENSSPAETPKGGKSSSFEEEYERKEEDVKVALDEVVHSLAAASSAEKAWSSGDQFAVKNAEAFALGKRRRRMNNVARANAAADTTDEDAFADVNNHQNAASSESSLSSSLRESLAKELPVLLSKVHLGAAPLTTQESFEARKNRLQKALLMATLLEKEEHDDHKYDDEKRTTTIQTTKTSTFLSRTRTTNTKTNDDENALTETIARELINHDVLGRYMNEIARFAYIRKTSHSGAASRRRAKRPKDRASNQKKPRQGLTREDMRREHRRWCAACQVFVKKEDALSVTKVLNTVVTSSSESSSGETSSESSSSSYADFIEATTRKERRCKKEKTKRKLLPHAIPTPTYKIVAFDHKKSSKSNPPPNGRSMFVCRRVCCVNMLNAKRVASNLKYKMPSNSSSKKSSDDSSSNADNSNSTATTTALEIMRDLKLLAERAERDDGVDSSGWKLRKPNDGDKNAKGRHPHRWTEPPTWVK
ncbi:unnamed protein product [Bathycoccus prasinos]